jgi:hypothetical protein
MILKLTGEPPTGGRVHVPWVYVDDDPEGNRWTFAQARPAMR